MNRTITTSSKDINGLIKYYKQMLGHKLKNPDGAAPMR